MSLNVLLLPLYHLMARTRFFFAIMDFVSLLRSIFIGFDGCR